MAVKWIAKILRRAESDSRKSHASERDSLWHTPGKSAVTVRADNPIRKPEDDALGRAKIARSFAQQVLSLDVTEGVVVGVLGPWGSGKTSFVNLSRAHFEADGVAVLDFNPWMFSGAEQLVESFFVELSTQLKLRSGLDELGKDLDLNVAPPAGVSKRPDPIRVALCRSALR